MKEGLIVYKMDKEAVVIKIEWLYLYDRRVMVILCKLDQLYGICLVHHSLKVQTIVPVKLPKKPTWFYFRDKVFDFDIIRNFRYTDKDLMHYIITCEPMQINLYGLPSEYLEQPQTLIALKSLKIAAPQILRSETMPNGDLMICSSD